MSELRKSVLFTLVLALAACCLVHQFSTAYAAPVINQRSVGAARRTSNRVANAPGDKKNADQSLRFADRRRRDLAAPLVPLPFNNPFTDSKLSNFISLCGTCQRLLPTLKLVSTTVDDPTIELAFKTICSQSLSFFGYDTDKVCPGLSSRYVPAVVSALRASYLTPDEICSLVNYCIVPNITMGTNGQNSVVDLTPFLTLSERRNDNRPARGGDANPSGLMQSQQLTDAVQMLALLFQDRLPHARTKASASRRGGAQTAPHVARFDRAARVSTSATPDLARLFGSRKSASRQPRSDPNKLERRNFPTYTQGVSPNATIRVLQLTDIHLDLTYAAGTKVDCGTYLCCQPSDGSGTAGEFGDYQCDLAPRTIRSLFAYINATFAFVGNSAVTNETAANGRLDFGIWNGDNPAHDFWNSTWTKNLNRTATIAAILKANLPQLPLFPTSGNHDYYPDNLFDPRSDMYQLDGLANVYANLVPNNTLNNFRYLGAYTTGILPGLRLVAMNTQFGYSRNYYVVLNSQLDIVRQHQEFLVTTLTNARASGEKVVLIGHVPPGTLDATPPYGGAVADLLTQFQDVIVLAAFGHEHLDYYQIAHAVSTANGTSVTLLDQPTRVTFIAPSLTPYVDLNPAFRVYTLNATTFELLDHETYFFNLTQANLDAKASGAAANATRLDEIALSAWGRLYSMKETFNMTDMSTTSFAALSQRLRVDEQLASLFVTLMHAGNGARPCDLESCAAVLYCLTNNAIVNYYAGCLEAFETNKRRSSPAVPALPLDYFGRRC
ncbi:hypothetical protein CAOG_07038 [Capsaspora owczarzaki ATCC 30864]|uniref:Saposin B-type domain-containing protein n=1 Tax=Capsaspora owczarzaki (strain ATCC 30864) TaxID=595528 RepID=A0A0D2UP49_CAPO3|nr:hypothetical protein CAOG_07038 [Capsaspora owczarzaki ATCC 30864]KJE96766.1 hypothetical protein CAOG_007038 [Capsaspora owczarzaki ATCC 30864]|eukprot:XP_004343762.2 hypothetical protein CAOG_07038 [Capsaspora owczarzaki ATCC 30864]